MKKSGELLIVGASSGLGHAISCLLSCDYSSATLVARSRPPSLDLNDGVNRTWVRCDLREHESVEALAKKLSNNKISCIVYTAGTWESTTNLSKLESKEIFEIAAVNASSFVALITRLLPPIPGISRCNVFAVASTAALDNATGPRAAYAASKHGIRGAVYSLREYYRNARVYVTCLSLGGLGSDVDPYADLAAMLEKTKGERIPSSDVVEIIRSVTRLSDASVAKEIVMPAHKDSNA